MSKKKIIAGIIGIGAVIIAAFEIIVEIDSANAVKMPEQVSKRVDSEENMAATESEAEVVHRGFIVQGDDWYCDDWYYYDETGNLVTGWFEINGSRYCAGTDGRLYRNGEHEIDSTKYQFDAWGVCTGEVEKNAWKWAYIMYIMYVDSILQKSGADDRYQLFYMDSDDIPELLVWKADICNDIIVTFDCQTGEIHESESLVEGGFFFGQIYYIEYQNFVDIPSGTTMGGGHWYDNIFRIENGIAKQIDHGYYHGDPEFDDIWTFHWGEEYQIISQEEYLSRTRESETEKIDILNDGINARQMIEVLKSY